MPDTSGFYVSKKDNRVRPMKGNNRSYFSPDSNSKNLGKAKFLIKVFASYNHEAIAKQIRDMVIKEKLEVFEISVNVKQ